MRKFTLKPVICFVNTDIKINFITYPYCHLNISSTISMSKVSRQVFQSNLFFLFLKNRLFFKLSSRVFRQSCSRTLTESA